MATKLGDFSQFATEMFSTKNLQEKYEIALRMIDACRSNAAKKESLRRDIRKFTSNNQFDFFASNMTLNDTDKVFKVGNRK